MKGKIVAAIGAAGVVIGLATPAFAAQPTGLGPNPNANSQGNCVGVYSSQVTHNGLVISQSQTTYPGQRAELVHQAQAASC